ncbi:MAG: (d)CMP kinase [Chitinivibrionales bacterium]
MIIAIDGPAGSGKSSTARMVAQALKILHLDTGAMYRAITLKCLRQGIAFTDTDAMGIIMRQTSIAFTGTSPDMRVWMDGEDVTGAIRGDEVTKRVSDYCTVPVVREELVGLQRKIAEGQSVVCEGRDIGTVVFPDADLKFFMVASIEERARRRKIDFERMGIKKDVTEIIAEITERDRKDSTRRQSPLKKADDAVEIDTTHLSINEQVALIVEKAKALVSH